MSDRQPSRTERAAAPLLEASGLGKRYGATTALDGVSFALRPGEVCGLLGENGAGKSTLVKILSGVVAPDSGHLRLGGAPYAPRTILDARRSGVATAFQELSLVPTLSVAVNLFLPRPRTNALQLVARRALEEEAGARLAEHGITDLRPSALVEELPLGLRQRLEIVRAMLHGPRVLLLDEPTAALADPGWLFALIAGFAERGSAVLYISHKLDEVRRVCERCIILRNGRMVLDAPVAQLSDADLFAHMAGRSVVEAFPSFASRPPAAAEPPALAARGLAGESIRGVSFEVRRGEVLGVAGLEGQGQSHLFRALVGLVPLERGEIEVDGVRTVMRSPRAARRAGVLLVPEERKTEGIFGGLSAAANVSLPIVNRLATLGLLRPARERKAVEEVAARVELPAQLLPLDIEALSGGNQQKAILARAWLAGPRCLLLFDPTRGVDVGTKQRIYAVMRDFARDGGAILFYSTELDELVHLCDRVLVLYRNAVVAELPREQLSREQLLSLASGHGQRARLAQPERHPA